MNTLNTTNNRYHIAQLKVFAKTLNAAAAVADDTYTNPVNVSSNGIIALEWRAQILLFSIE